jgi:tetratricopeptide (TPR) repeat protein
MRHDAKSYTLPIVIFLAFIVRLLHLASAPNNPLTYHPGPDEDFYIRFAQDVVHGQFGLSLDFIFMDPLYGYLLGLVFSLFGQNLFIVYLLQVIIDTLTTFLIYLVAKQLWSHRAGVFAACLYALTSTAILYTTAILKTTLVAHFVVLWVYIALRMWHTDKLIVWFWYGIFLGIGVTLRANLLLLALVAMILVPWGNTWSRQARIGQYGIRLSMLALGLSLPLLLLASRISMVTDHWSLFPPNGGIVLHQIYNPENPTAEHHVPGFVAYSSPSEIWSSYRLEAESRQGQKLPPYEVNDYWHRQALDYIADNPGLVFQNMLRKLGEFTAYHETSYNRSLEVHAMFSPVLNHLPLPFGWLLAFGIPGLVLIIRRNPGGWVLIGAIGATIATYVVFVAAARFRFHALPLFAIGSGVYLATLMNWRHQATSKNSLLISISIVIGMMSIWNERLVKDISFDWTPIAWGYLKMGQIEQADGAAKKELLNNPRNPGAHELSGYIAITEENYLDAITHYQNALTINPNHHIAHYNLGISLEKLGKTKEALAAISTAVKLIPLPEYLYHKGRLHEQTGEINQAISSYQQLLDLPGAVNQNYTEEAHLRLQTLEHQ